MLVARNNNQQAIIQYQGHLTTVVEQIMRKVVANKSRILYHNNNIILILWLYDNEEHREEVLCDWMVEDLNRADSLDQATNGTRRAYPVVRTVCKKALDSINKVDNNCPILLNKLTFNLFSHYLTTCKSKKGEYLSEAGQIQSSLKHLYQMSGEKMEEEYEDELLQFMIALKQTVISTWTESGRSLDEGKKGMSYEVFKHVSEILFKSDD